MSTYNQLPPLLALDKSLSLLIYFTCFRISYNWNYLKNMYFFVSGLFWSAQLKKSSMLLNLTVVHPLYCWVLHCMNIHSLFCVNIYNLSFHPWGTLGVSRYILVTIKLLWTVTHESFHGPIYFSNLEKHLIRVHVSND